MSQVSQYVQEALLEPNDENLRVTQVVIDLVKVPSTANVRVTQMVIEWIKVPTTAAMRVTQMVIELPFAAGSGIPFWMDMDIDTSDLVSSWTDNDN